MTVKKYRKKPVVIEAIQYNVENGFDCALFLHPDGIDYLLDDINVNTLEGNVLLSKGDYIIKGVKGEFYPCKPDIFAMTYEDVSDD